MACECECHREEWVPKKRSASRRLFKTLFRASRGFFAMKSRTVPEKEIEPNESAAISPRADDEDRSTGLPKTSRTRSPEERRLAPELPIPSTGIFHLDCNFPNDTVKISYSFKCPAAVLQNLRNEEIERLNFAARTNGLSNVKFRK